MAEPIPKISTPEVDGGYPIPSEDAAYKLGCQYCRPSFL